MVTINQIELIIAAIRNPSSNERLCQPGTPAPLNAHPDIDLRGHDKDTSQDEQRKDGSEKIDRRRVAFLNRVKNPAIPDVDAILEADIYADHSQKPERKQPGQPIAATAPEPSRADPETLQQIFSASLLGLLRRQAQSRFHLLWRERIIVFMGIVFGCCLGASLVGTNDRLRSCVIIDHGR